MKFVGVLVLLVACSSWTDIVVVVVCDFALSSTETRTYV